MVELLIGKKGSGKTKALIEKVNNALSVAKGNVLYVTGSDDSIFDVKSKARLVNTTDFDIKTYGEFLGFIFGIVSRDYDITNVFIDSISKIVGTSDLDGFEQFLNRLEEMGKKFNIDFVISVSVDAETAPDYIKRLA